MKLGVFSSLARAYLTVPGLARLMLPAACVTLTGIAGWPWNGTSQYLLRETGPDLFSLAAAVYLLTAGIIAARTGGELAARGRLYTSEQLLRAGVPAQRQYAEKTLFHLLYALLLTMLSIPPLLVCGAVSGMTLNAALWSGLFFFSWTLLIESLGLFGLQLFPGDTILRAAMPMSAGALLLLLNGSAADFNPLLIIQSLSGSSFFAVIYPDHQLTAAVSGLLIIIIQAAAALLLWLRVWRIDGRG